jgi:hypothetical protein
VKPLETIYWLRFGFGTIAGLVCAGYALATGTISNLRFETSTLLNGIALTIIVYFLSYYYIKYKFRTQVEKTSKLMTTGIGIYLLVWMVLWILIYTILAGPV